MFSYKSYTTVKFLSIFVGIQVLIKNYPQNQPSSQIKCKLDYKFILN